MFKYPPNLPDAVCEKYKTVDGIELNIWRFEPSRSAHPLRPAILFFFGGGFRMGSPEQFAAQARHLAERGMIAMVADYRVASRHGTKGVDCLADAKAAFAWVRANAQRLMIDPQRIAAAGGSAGGYLAAATALVPGFIEDSAHSQQPDALVLFNPAVVMASIGERKMDPERLAQLSARMGTDDPESISPYHHIHADAPPMIIFHGRADTTIPFATVNAFTQKMNEVGNHCELVDYDGEEHGFFNIGRGDGTHYADTLSRMDDFLVSLGWLDPI